MNIRFLDLSELIGKTFTSVINNGEIVFSLEDGKQFRLGHIQDCCEDVWLEDVVGDLSDLENTPILASESVDNNDNRLPEDVSIDDSYTWSYYNFRTIKGSVQVRFFGTSNGYYSETADLYEII